MSFENPTIIPQKESLDTRWYTRFETLGSFQDYEQLTGEGDNRENQKKKLIAGEIENPTLDYPELEKFNFEEIEAGLINLKRDILNSENNPVVRQVYRWKINEKLADLRLLRASKEGNDKRVARYSQFIYGNPEQNIYEYTLFQIKTVIDKNLVSEDSAKKEAAKRLNAELFEALMNNNNEISPEKYELPAVQKKKEELEYSATEIKIAFDDFLKEKKLGGWNVVIDQDGRFTSINVSQEKKEINIPRSRKLKESNLRSLIAHELGTHVLRRELGERSKLRLLGLGLDRYLKGEEGIATFEEQKIKGASEFAGLDGHLAVALAMGMDSKKRSFKEVFNILKDIYFIQSKKTGNEAIKSAEDSAWSRCVRTFRGTTCKTPGAVLTRDIVYREGNIGIWNLVKNNPDEVRRFSVGKYDPTNSRHIWILEQLGITDADLASLEQD